MPLKPVKRSVLFHKGLSDGSDRFLVEPPSIDYAENLTLGKDGSFSKRYGFEEIAATGTPPSGEVLFMRQIGDSLHVVTDEGVSSVIDGKWVHTSVPGFIGSSAMPVESQVYPGIASADWWMTYDGNGQIVGYVMALEIRERASPTMQSNGQIDVDDLKSHILFQHYDSSGKFVSQTRIDNAMSPKIVQSNDGNTGGVTLFYLSLPDMSLMARFYNLSQDLFPSAAVDVGIDIWPFFVLPSHGQNLHYTRLGGSTDGLGRYQVAYLDGGFYGVVAVPETDTSKVIVRVLNTAYATTDSTDLYIGGSVGEYTRSRAEPLDIVGAGSNVLILWTQASTVGTNASQVYLTKYPVSGSGDLGASATLSLLDMPQTFTHGGLSVYLNTVSWAVHEIGLFVDDSNGPPQEEEIITNWFAVRDNASGIRIGSVDYVNMVSLIAPKGFPAHRLASRPKHSGDGKLYMAIQQYFDATPYVDESLINNYGYAGVAGAQQPKTTILAHIDLIEGTVSPVAYVDANQSLACEYAISEFTKHVPRLQIDGDSIYMLNRVTLDAEDLNIRYDDIGYSGTWPPWSTQIDHARIGHIESQARNLCRIHHIAKGSGARDIYASSLGDGFVVNTAVPLWFDGRWFGELSPMDKPEIITIRDKRWTDRYLLGQIPNEKPLLDYQRGKGDERWRKLQVVIGYCDHHGNIHRSAPSATLWANELTPEDANEEPEVETDPEWPINWVGNNVFVYVTRPVTLLPDDIEYFIEVYASTVESDGSGGEASDPILIGSSSFSSGNKMKSDLIDYALVSLVRWGGGSNNEFFDPPRTSAAPYTTGALAADTWPAFRASVATSTRLWAIDAINAGRVIASKLFEDFISPEYNPTLSINLGDERNLTAIGKLDDKVVVFEPNDIHVIYGDGPDNRGQGQEFAVHYISTDVGCQDQKSVIETPAGLIFYSSPRGFYLLDRNLQIQFIGSAVEDIASGIRIKAATIDPGNAEVRFLVEPDPNATQTEKYGPDADTTVLTRPPRPVFGNPLPDDACLVFFYETGDWMLYTNYPGLTSCMYQGRYTMILPDGTLWKESEDYQDPTGTNRTLLRSPWIKLSETIQDYNRLWRITILGRYLSALRDLGGQTYEAGDVVVRLYFDYEAQPLQEKRFRVQDFGFNPWNQTQKRAERFQFEIHPKRGRTQAIQIEIEEVNSEDRGEGISYGLGAGFEIVSAELFVGAGSTRSLLPQAVKA